MKRCGLRFAPDGQLHLVITRWRKRSLRTSAGIECARDLDGIIVPQIPCEPIHSFSRWNGLHALDTIRPFGGLLGFFLFLARKMADDFARAIENVE